MPGGGASVRPGRRFGGLCASALAVLAAPAAQAAEPLLCLGTRPGFMMTIDEDSVRFDYLGDGTFTLDPPLASRDFRWSRHTLVTARERWDLYLESRACRVLQATLPVTVEIGVPTSDGIRPMTGCCKWHEN